MTLDAGRMALQRWLQELLEALDAAVAYAKERQQFGKPVLPQCELLLS